MAYSAGVALENAHSLARAQQKEMQLSVLLGAMDALPNPCPYPYPYPEPEPEP